MLRVLVSHGPDDSAAARQVAEHLESAGNGVWLAERDILPGDDRYEALRGALEDSDAMVVVVSPSTFDSPNVQGELDYALTHLRFKNRVLPVMVGKVQHGPWILKKLHDTLGIECSTPRHAK